jgi:hypothetical protein
VSAWPVFSIILPTLPVKVRSPRLHWNLHSIRAEVVQVLVGGDLPDAGEIRITAGIRGVGAERLGFPSFAAKDKTMKLPCIKAL